MLKILWKRGEIAPEEQFLLLSTIFFYLILDFDVKTRIRFSLPDKRIFEITEVEITRVDCNYIFLENRVDPDQTAALAVRAWSSLLAQTFLSILSISSKRTFL